VLVLVLRLVQVTREADDAVRVDETGRRDFRREHAHARRCLHLALGADGDDLAALDHDDAVLDHGAGDGVDALGLDREILRESGEHEREAREDTEEARLHHFTSSPTQHNAPARASPAPQPPSAHRRSSGFDRSNTFAPSTQVCSTCV
jgi:hypothetical protein